MWISQKGKAWRKYHGSGHFTRYLSIAVALKTSVKVCSHPHSPQPSLAMQFDLCDTASPGHFLLKTKHWALLSVLSLCCCDSPLPNAVTRVISCTQDSYTTSNVILWAVIRSCSPRLRQKLWVCLGARTQQLLKRTHLELEMNLFKSHVRPSHRLGLQGMICLALSAT